LKKFYLSDEELADFFAELYALRQSEIPESKALQIMAEGTLGYPMIKILQC
jgi:hypothetical protein